MEVSTGDGRLLAAVGLRVPIGKDLRPAPMEASSRVGRSLADVDGISSADVSRAFEDGSPALGRHCAARE